MYKELEVNSLAELIEVAQLVETQSGSQLWFRGHHNHEWHLVPSAHRRNPLLEATVLNNFRMRAPAFRTDCPQHQDYASWLPLMQHYGLPTRLLDWTESLVVAAYFASSHPLVESPASIWMLDPGHLNQLSVGYLIPFLTDERVAPIIREAFGTRIDTKYQEAISVIAPRRDIRMMVQLGNYTIHRNSTPIENYPDASKFLTKVTIPPDSITAIRRDLSVCGIRHSSLFPDLSSLATELSEIIVIDDQ
ncbi:FRG domain-containing protein [Desulfoplanes sp. PS50]|jgi:hypothetical protein